MTRYEEYQICKQRGHVPSSVPSFGWTMCDKCKTHYKLTYTLEEKNAPEAPKGVRIIDKGIKFFALSVVSNPPNPDCVINDAANKVNLVFGELKEGDRFERDGLTWAWLNAKWVAIEGRPDDGYRNPPNPEYAFNITTAPKYVSTYRNICGYCGCTEQEHLIEIPETDVLSFCSHVCKDCINVQKGGDRLSKNPAPEQIVEDGEE